MRAATFGVNPHGMLSRGVAGIAGRTLIVNLPGSVKGVEESLAVIAPCSAACDLSCWQVPILAHDTRGRLIAPLQAV